MKKILLSVIITLVVSFTASAIRFTIPDGTTITSNNGCLWTMSGWVEVTFGWDPPVQISHYDVTMTGPCGTYHFVACPVTHLDPNNQNISLGTSYYFYDDNMNLIPIDQLPYDFIPIVVGVANVLQILY